MKNMIDNESINDILLVTADSLCISKKQEKEIKKSISWIESFLSLWIITSIIITTLCAQTYEPGDNALNIIKKFIDNHDIHIHVENGIYCINNPILKDENFADIWNDRPLFKEAFDKWIKQLESDFSDLLHSQNMSECEQLASKIFAIN